MPETKFWSAGGSQSVNTIGSKSPKVEKKPNKIVTILGIIGGFLFVLLAVVAFAGYVYIVKPGQELMSEVQKLQASTKKVEESLVKRDLVQTEADLTVLEKGLNELRKSRDAKFGWAANIQYTKPYFDDSDHFINSGLYAIDSLREAIIVVKPFADAAGLKVSGAQDTSQSSLLEAFSTWIAVMPKVADDLDGVIAKLDKVGTELAKVDANRYPEEFNGTEIRSNIVRAQTLLSQVDDYAPDIKQALTIVPGLLGVGTGEKRYMVIMQNDKEIRATGGFWTNYATFKIKNGLLSSDFSSKDMYSIDNTLDIIDATFTFPRPPLSYAKYLKVERWYARDANYSPDFPTSIDQFMYSYNIAQRIAPLEIKPVDGIFAMDTQVLRELLQVTGNVTVNGFTYTPDNVVLELEKIASLELKEQANRKRVLGDLMERMLINVFESDKNLWPKLIEKGIDLAVRKHIQGYSFDPAAQKLLEKYNLAGRIVDPVDGDYSYTVQTNLGGDKTNWFVSKSVAHTVAQENGRWVHEVKITYNYPQPDPEFTPFIKRFRDWVRVYAPNGSEIIKVDGSEDGTTTDQERNKTFFTGYVELGPTETKTLSFKYYLPANTVKGDMYNLYLQKQNGIDSEVHTITLNGKTQKIDLKTDQKIWVKLK